MRVHAMQGDTVDLLCWRHLGSTAGLVERTYLLNPGLAERGRASAWHPGGVARGNHHHSSDDAARAAMGLN